jgi:hypothetical protein
MACGSFSTTFSINSTNGAGGFYVNPMNIANAGTNQTTAFIIKYGGVDFDPLTGTTAVPAYFPGPLTSNNVAIDKIYLGNMSIMIEPVSSALN